MCSHIEHAADRPRHTAASLKQEQTNLEFALRLCNIFKRLNEPLFQLCGRHSSTASHCAIIRGLGSAMHSFSSIHHLQKQIHITWHQRSRRLEAHSTRCQSCRLEALAALKTESATSLLFSEMHTLFVYEYQ
jgi:hypothetical protein